jgi:uncharacterized cupredoxin-like copper-binding protein
MTKHVKILLLVVAAFAMFAVATAQAKPTRSAASVTVTEGKPSEFGIKLSTKTGKVGSVTFSVTNGGTVPHDFKVCSIPTTKAPVDTCKGKGTRLLSPGQSQSLAIKFLKAGKYEYLCTVAGHATAGMKGLFTVK